MNSYRLFFALGLLFTATTFTVSAADGVSEAPNSGSGTSQSSPATTKGSKSQNDDC